MLWLLIGFDLENESVMNRRLRRITIGLVFFLTSGCVSGPDVVPEVFHSP